MYKHAQEVVSTRQMVHHVLLKTNMYIHIHGATLSVDTAATDTHRERKECACMCTHITF